MDESSTIPERAAHEMDQALTRVMPDSWHGFARLLIDRSDLSDQQKEFAKKLSARLLDQRTTDDAEEAGRVAIKKAKEKVSA
jgi:hypothetical protein